MVGNPAAPLSEARPGLAAIPLREMEREEYSGRSGETSAGSRPWSTAVAGHQRGAAPREDQNARLTSFSWECDGDLPALAVPEPRCRQNGWEARTRICPHFLPISTNDCGISTVFSCSSQPCFHDRLGTKRQLRRMNHAVPNWSQLKI